MSPSRRPYNAAQLFTEQLSTRDLTPEPGTSTTTSYSGYDYYNNGTRVQPISRAIHPSDAQRPNSHIALDRSNRRPEPHVISDLTSWTSQRSGGSKPDSATPTCPPLPSAAHPTYEMGRNHSTRSNSLDPFSSSHIRPGNFPPSLRRNEPQAFEVPDSSHHNLGQYREITFDFDRTSATSTQSQSSRPSTRASVLSSTLSVAATSMTSFSSGPSRIGAPKLDLEIPSHSLFVDNPPLSSFSQGPGNRMRTSTSLNWDQEILRQTAENSTLPPSSNLSRHLQACSIEHTTSSLDQDQGISRPPEASPQISPIRIRFLQDSTPIEQAIRSRLQTVHSVDGVVTSGTLEGLVWFLISGSGRRGHNYYRDTFLTACSELTIPEDLFQILSRRMSEEVNTSNDGFGRQYTIFLIVKHWLRSNTFPPNEELLSRIKVFCKDAIHRYPSLETIAKEACQLIDAKVTRPTAERTSHSPHRDEPILDSSQLKPSDLAVALGLLEGDNYKALQPSDYLLYLTKDQSGDRVKIYHETNEKIRLWAIRSILHFDTVSNRSEVMKFFILTALECHSMRNFSSTVAISSALHSASVESLKATRKALSKKTQAKLPALYDIIDPLSSHRGYYAAIHDEAATESKRNTCIPWLPVHFKELNRLGAVREPFTVQVDGHHLVNFNRYNRFMDCIKKTLHYSAPDLEDKRHGGQLTYLLNQLCGIDLSGSLERQLLEQSRALSIQESSINHTIHAEKLRQVGFDVY